QLPSSLSLPDPPHPRACLLYIHCAPRPPTSPLFPYTTLFRSCAKVTQSPQSAILGVPVALLGLLYFAAIGPLHLPAAWRRPRSRSEEHTSELQSHLNLVCRLLLEKKKSTHDTERETQIRMARI